MDLGGRWARCSGVRSWATQPPLHHKTWKRTDYANTQETNLKHPIRHNSIFREVVLDLNVKFPSLYKRIQYISVFSCLSGKRRTVTAAELDEFKKQAECLNLPLPFTPNPEGGMNIPAVFCSLKGLYVTFRYCLFTVTPVAVKSTTVSILLLSLCDRMWLTGIMLTACFSLRLLKILIACWQLIALYSFHREAQQCQQSYVSWMKTLTVSEPDGII